MNFLQEAMLRFSAEKPPFFVTLQKIGLWLGFIAGLPLLAAQAGLDLTFLPDTVHQAIAFCGFIAALIAQFTATTAEKQTLKIE